MSNLIENIKIKIKLRKNFFILLIAFLIGILIPTIPYINNNISNWNNKRLKILENENFKIRLEENCKLENSKYKKLQNLGFEKFAMEEFNNCFKESLINK